MNRLYIIHGFERESTFLVDVPTSVLQEPVEETEFDSDHDHFMRTLPLPTNGHLRTNFDATELGVMQVAPINGSKAFHRRFLKECALYCRLHQRLQRAAEWLLAGTSTLSSATQTQQNPCDVDGLSNAVYPLEPTAFAAAAFALPPLLSVVPAHPQNVEVARAASIAPLTTVQLQEDGGDFYGPSDPTHTVPYCLFYSSVIPTGSSSSVIPLTKRFSAVAIATGVCGVLSSSDSTLRSNRSKNGLSLSAYLEGRLPRSVYSGFLSAGNTDPFAQWSEDVLWRLLSSLVSALAVVHASGMHYRGELTADDILCFALPNDVSTVPQQSDVSSVDPPKNTSGRRIAEWVASTHNRWVITDNTPAHQAYFMITALPRSLFSDGSRIPADVIVAQRRDVAAIGRLFMAVLEEKKRRRMDASSTNRSASLTGCSELLFVAERMTAVDDSGMISIGEAPANRFAQLQAIRLRTQLCLLRATLEEQQAQFSADFCRRGGPSVHSRDDGCGGASPPRLLSCTRATPNPSCSVELTLSESKIRERERLLTEREEKLNRFLELYELTAERLDELPIGKEGYSRLKESLRLNAVAATTPNKALSASWRKVPDSPQSPSPQKHVPLPTSPTVEGRVGSLYGLLRFPKSEESPSTANTTTTTTGHTATTNGTNTSAVEAAGPTGSASIFRSSLSPNAKNNLEAKVRDKVLATRFKKSNTHPSDRPRGSMRGSSGGKSRDTSAPAQRSTIPTSPEGRMPIAAKAAVAPATTTAATVTTRTSTSSGTANRTTSQFVRPISRSPPMRTLHTNVKTLLNGFSHTTPKNSLARSGMPSKPKNTPSSLSTNLGSSPQHVHQSPAARPLRALPQQPRWSPVPATVALSPQLSPVREKNPTTQGFTTPPVMTPLRHCTATGSAESSQRRTPSAQSWRQVQMSPTLANALQYTSPRHLSASTPKRQDSCSLTSAAAKCNSSSSSQRQRDFHSVQSRNGSASTQERSMPRCSTGFSPQASYTPVRESPHREVSAEHAIRQGESETPNRQRRSQNSMSTPTPALGSDTLELSRERNSESSERKTRGTRLAAARRHHNDSEKKIRTTRLRGVNDGWIDNHLAALEQLRCDFLQSEALKSLRTTPNRKMLRGSRVLRFSPDQADKQTAAAATCDGAMFE